MTEIRSVIVAAMKDRGFSDRKSRDIAFHMTDWIGEFIELKKFYEAPEKLSSEEISILLSNFLIHVPAHVAAAAKLVTDSPVRDVFGLGAVSETKVVR